MAVSVIIYMWNLWILAEYCAGKVEGEEYGFRLKNSFSESLMYVGTPIFSEEKLSLPRAAFADEIILPLTIEVFQMRLR